MTGHDQPAAQDRSYVTVFSTGTIHLARYVGNHSVDALCGRNWHLTDVGISSSRSVGPLCVHCRKAEASRV